MTNEDPQPISALWQNEFNVDNLIDYARASKDLSDYIRVLVKEGYRHLVVPSRGAVPFINAAAAAWRLDVRALPNFDDRLREMTELTYSPFHQKLVLPFSADPQDATQTTMSIRRYWSRVLAALVRRNGTDPHLTLYKVLVESLAKRSWLAALPSKLPTEKFIFVDTVVSGRAICEIFKAFEELGLNECHFVLIVDARGAEVASRYQREITAMADQGRCTVIPVNRLFTEDRGPAVSGVWSTVYPQVLDAVRQRFEWARDAYGAGTFYWQVSSSQVKQREGIGTTDYNMPVTQMYASISVGIFTAVRALQDLEGVEQKLVDQVGRHATGFEDMLSERKAEIEINLRRQLKYQLMSFRESVDEMRPYSPMDKETTRTLAEPRVLEAHPNAVVEVSSSHLVRVKLPESEVARVMIDAEREIALGKDVLDDDWFR
ncbi:hypothetical protein [Pelomonas aquatica]|jgi:hypothetical protein|uniref:Uncharacterized protein n=1 Tax=Pelomonas aquatica TaxID=431058 RepID=A0A9X4R3Y3_9BURK|nr:hypothetical protein [Pelomonas aquatica]MCY4754413.1 hypothetical protein [Pelomonas aquatica]MDG0861539.1 hypothetical protein [Pelomonas aquatica]